MSRSPFLVLIALAALGTAACGGTPDSGHAGSTDALSFVASRAAHDGVKIQTVIGAGSPTVASSQQGGEAPPCTAATQARECVLCVEVVDDGGDPQKLCGSSKTRYETLQDCACRGVCARACATSFCVDRSQDEWCYACLDDLTNGCGTELAACLAD